MKRVTILLATSVVAVCGCSSGSGAGSAPSSTSAPGGPSTSLIAYQTDGGLGGSIWLSVIGTDRSGDHPIVKIKGTDVIHPRWSGDGKRLVFTECPSNSAKCTLVEANPSGGQRHTVYDCGKQCFGGDGAAWSPDSKQVAFAQWSGPLTRPPTFCGLAIVTPGGSARTITHAKCPPNGDAPAFPRWSPDGKKLVFYELRTLAKNAPAAGPLDDSGTATATAVFTINIDGSVIHQLTPWRMDAGDPDWSPNGNLIVFTTHPLGGGAGVIWDFSDATSNIYTIRPDGTGLRQLTHYQDGSVSRACQPTWTSDGNILYVLDEGGANVSNRSTWMMSADGSNRHQVTPDGIYTHPQAQP